MSRCRQLVVLGLLALAASGCGQGLGLHNGRPASEQLIGPADIRNLPPGSPRSALLTWWRDVQFGNAVGYLSFLASPVAAKELQANVVQQYVPILSSQLQSAKPQILSVDVLGNTATVYVTIVARQPVGNQSFVTTSEPQAFSLVKDKGHWRLVDDFFIRRRVQPALRGAASAQP